MRVPRKCAPSNEEVKEALAPLNAPICPHLRLNDEFVANAYSQDCRRLRLRRGPDCQCSVCFGADCRFCETHIYFCIISERYGLQTLRIHVSRSFEKTSRCTDRAWLCHVADPADFEEYKMAWQAANAVCLQKVGPVVDPF